KLVSQAGSKGIPVVIYRLPFISGSMKTGKTGAGNLKDSLSRFVLACKHVVCVPDIDMEINMMPVDYVSSAVIALSTRSDVFGRAFNLVNARSTHVQELLDCLLSSGLQIQKVPYDEWRSRCDSSGALASLLEFYPERIDQNRKALAEPKIDGRDT